uniref:BLTX305 n=1 Tax=Nephila pilipes TaxID=299642 RepID=A0A076KZV7_NEPPI|nr:BLTX305 [Nephila pilipes]
MHNCMMIYKITLVNVMLSQ